MGKKKLSTEEILKQARAQAAKSESSASPGAAEPQSQAPSEDDSPKPAAKPATPKAGGAAKAGGAPKSTADILAAARAQSGKGAAGDAEAKTDKPSAKPKPAAKAAAKPAGDRPSVQDMLKAVREGKPTAPVVEDAGKPSLPPRPAKPAATAKPRAPEPARRNMLAMALLGFAGLFTNAFAAAWTLFTASVAAFSLALARFMMPNVLVEPPSKFKVGPPSDYPLGTASTKWTAQFGIWVVHVNYNGRNEIYALSTVCTHLGCTPNWLEGEQKFKCPCHGSGFYITGINFEGPAPRPLERYGIRLAEDGMLEVDKSVKFQQEMGQWSEPASFVPVA